MVLHHGQGYQAVKDCRKQKIFDNTEKRLKASPHNIQIYKMWSLNGKRISGLPVYSVLEVTEEVVDAFSQSFSPFLLLERLGDRKPSTESGLK